MMRIEYTGGSGYAEVLDMEVDHVESLADMVMCRAADGRLAFAVPQARLVAMYDPALVVNPTQPENALPTLARA